MSSLFFNIFPFSSDFENQILHKLVILTSQTLLQPIDGHCPEHGSQNGHFIDNGEGDQNGMTL